MINIPKYNRMSKNLLRKELIANYVCGDCIHFKGICMMSYIEAKYGNSKTPACLEDFERRNDDN